MPDTIPLYIGTRNPKKGREMAQLIAPPWLGNPRLARVEVRTLDGHPEVAEVVEDLDTFGGNARKKATEVAVQLGAWVLADDSGLTVDALGGAPGVFSARYAGEPADDDANNRKLLEALAATANPADRSAAFRCHLALSDPGGQIRLEAEGACRGRILTESRGHNGFGYDPLFEIVEAHRTFGELSALVKGQLSHRARAFEKLRPGLDRLIAEGAMSGDRGGRE